MALSGAGLQTPCWVSVYGLNPPLRVFLPWDPVEESLRTPPSLGSLRSFPQDDGTIIPPKFPSGLRLPSDPFRASPMMTALLIAGRQAVS